MAKTTLTARVTPSKAEAAILLAQAEGTNTSSIINDLIPSYHLASAVIEEAKADSIGVVETLRNLVVEALKSRMLSAGMDGFEINNITDPEHIFQEFRRFQDASDTATEYRLEVPPRGGEWEKRGVTGKILVRQNEKLTRNGIERVLS